MILVNEKVLICLVIICCTINFNLAVFYILGFIKINTLEL